MTRAEKIIFGVILGVGIFLIFFRLDRQDMLYDDALYSMRAYGYFDYLASIRQTAPVQWFGDRPWWSYLSFHDHPPLYTLIQHGFYKLFGDSITVSRLTSALAAVGSVTVIFFLGRRFGNNRTGLLATSALAVNNYFFWENRMGYLEPLMMFWILLALLYLIKGLQDRPGFFVASGIFFGAAFITKYSVLFVVPAVLVFLLLRHRWVFGDKKFWFGIVAFVAVSSPVLFYNFMLQKTRGHFDAVFYNLFGQSNSDWVGLGNRIGGWQFSVGNLAQALISGLSWPYFLAAAASIAAVFVLVWRYKQRFLELPLLVTIFLFAFLSYLGAAERWVGMFAPFFALLMGIALSRIWGYKLARGLAAVLAVYCLVFVFNTNHALKASERNIFISTLRKENLGYNQLDRRLSSLLEDKRPDPAVAELTYDFWYDEINKEAINFNSIRRAGPIFPYLIVYDANIPWSGAFWIFERRKFYYRFFVASSDEYLAYVADENTRKKLQSLENIGIYFIRASQTTALPPSEEIEETRLLRQRFDDQGIKPEIVYDDKGREAFYLYDGLAK